MSKILVIDDECEIVEIVQTAAKRIGIECIGTTDPSEFLRVIDESISLIVLDVKMPGCDGLQLLRILKEDKGYKGNLLIMSGLGKRQLETTSALALSHGFASMGRLDKPFRPEEIDAALKKYCAPVAGQVGTRQPTEQISLELLNEALANELIEVHFQPQLWIASNRVSGVEALARIRHPLSGLIYPDCFIPLAEEMNLIDELGLVVAKKVFLVAADITRAAGETISVSVNMAAQSLLDRTLPDRLLELANEHSVDPKTVVLEVTESGMVEDLTSLMETLLRLNVHGFRLSLDDFGTGHAMMEQLKRVPAEELKIDRQFVQQIGTQGSGAAVVKATIDLGHRLDMHVVAEGVETEVQLDALRKDSCDIVQGYLVSRPLPLLSLIDWLTARSVLGGTR